MRGTLAQLAERRSHNPEVVSSSLTCPTAFCPAFPAPTMVSRPSALRHLRLGAYIILLDYAIVAAICAVPEEVHRLLIPYGYRDGYNSLRKQG